MHLINELARPIRLLIMDVDGVLTDGHLYFTARGEEIKSFHTLDGQGLKMLQSTGVKLAIITGRIAPSVQHRVHNLGIDYYYEGQHDKRQALADLLAKTDLTPTCCAYIGDDVVDLPVMIRVGFAIAVPGAPNLVREKAHYVTGTPGGQGAVREVCDLILRAQGHYESLMDRYLE